MSLEWWFWKDFLGIVDLLIDEIEFLFDMVEFFCEVVE